MVGSITFFTFLYALAIGSPRGVQQTEQQGRTCTCACTENHAGLCASDAARRCKTRYAHRRRRRPSEPPAVAVLSHVGRRDRRRHACAPHPRPTWEVASHKHVLLSQARQHHGQHRQVAGATARQPSMYKRPELDTHLTSAHTGGRPCLGVAGDVDGNRRGDLVPTLGENREDMPRPP